MTASDPRVDGIQARLAAATPGRWYVEGEPDEAKSVVQYTSANGISVGTYIVDVNERDEDAEFIANAPADVAYLLAELRARDEKLARVEAVEQRLERSMQGEDREIAEDLRAAMGDAQ